jgi:3-phosphoshikimate 1-carboxyvinyltransferase
MKKIPKKIKPAKRIEGKIVLPGDKSISHRAVMIGSIAEGVTAVENFLNAEDCIATTDAFKKMGVNIRLNGKVLVVKGAGLKGLKKPLSKLYLGNSGTTMRLLLGILAGQNFEATLSGDESLSNRPMKRVTMPLRQMGADIQGKDDANFAPLAIHGGRLRPIDYVSPIASAQVKSSILLAGLYAEGITTFTEPFKSRDHTERMLTLFNADISIDNLKVLIKRTERLSGTDISVPGDISSGAFFIVAALLIRNSEIILSNVGFNKTRTGIIDILKRMGARIEARNMRENWEPICDLVVSSSELKAATVEKSEIPRSIDELPVLMTAAIFAKGRTVIKGAAELRVKETDRINSMLYNLNKMGAKVACEGDDIVIEGTCAFHGAELSSFGDHRTAMAASIAALCSSSGDSVIDDVSCINTSFPEFFNILKAISVY